MRSLCEFDLGVDMLRDVRAMKVERANSAETGVGQRRANATDSKVGGRLRLRRKMLGLTQEQLAAECGLTYQQIHKYESGQSRISVSRLLQLSALLEVSASWFFDGMEVGSDDAQDSLGVLEDRDARALFAVYARITSKKRKKQLFQFAKLLADEDIGD